MLTAAPRSTAGFLPPPLTLRLDRWLLRRCRALPGKVVLASRNLYILPTRFGWMYATILVALYFGAVSFGSNLTHALAYLLLAIALLDMRQTHRQLLGLTLATRTTAPVFAGDAAIFTVHVADTRQRARPWVHVRLDGDPATQDGTIARTGETEFALPHPTTRRGWLVMPAVQIASDYPLGLFCVWSWQRFDHAALVYPRPIPPPFVLQGEADDQADGTHVPAPAAAGDAELSHLRDYQRGDAPRRIAWKALARNDLLLTKAFAAPPLSEVWLDWDTLPAADEDTRLGWLTAAVLAAHSEGRPYGLRLPGVRVAPALGESHQAACLRALALHGLPDYPPARNSDAGGTP